MSRFPDGKTFAFTVFDDTDLSTVQNVEPVYRFLAEIGMRSTKSVWPLGSVSEGRYGGESLADSEYLRFVRRLQDAGFEIALHGVRNYDSSRNLVGEGLRRYREELGTFPRVHANHSSNRDNIYWGLARLSSTAARLCYSVATRFRQKESFCGHIEKSRYFWGDLCRDHIDYVRNFVLNEINVERINPTIPYHDPARPYVNWWFSSCEGGDVNTFCAMLREEQQDQLEAEGGVCIMYTHFAGGFVNGGLHPRFAELMRRLAKRNGWFVPVSTLLDFLRAEKKGNNIPARELARLEQRWLMYKMRLGRT